MKRVLLILFIVGVISLSSVEFENIANEIKEINLANGAKLLLIIDDTAPIIHCATVANVGGVNEVPGKTGIAHFLEHLAFKGTSTIGTKDYEAEKLILDQEDAVFDKLLNAKKSGDDELVTKYEKELELLEDEASKYVENNEFSRIYTQNGGKNFNASTSQDWTRYQISLPSNKLELWFVMESERFTDPVFREFYKEREVILEERLLREVNSGQGQLRKKMMNTVFDVHPYKYTTIGEKEDIENITRQDVKDFFNKYYGAQNLTFVLYGDIDEKQARSYAKKYLSKIPKREKSLLITVKEPQQTKEKRVTVDYDTSPTIWISYHVPSVNHPDSDAINALATIFGQTETSPLMKTAIYKNKSALYAVSFYGSPGTKYDNLFDILFMPNRGVEIDACILEIDNILAEFLKEGVSEKELLSYKKNAKMSYLSRLDTGIYLPLQVGAEQVTTGDYSNLFKTLENIDSVNSDDIMRVAKKYLVTNNRTVGVLQREGE